jgi:hypothetical protein
VARADGRFRKRLFEAARAGEGVDQRLIVEGSPVPLAVVNGGADRLVNLDYFDTVAYGNLWEGHCHRLASVHKCLRIRDLCKELAIIVSTRILQRSGSGKLRPTLVWCLRAR